MTRGLEPQYEALVRNNESTFRAAKGEGDQLNLAYMQANEAFINYATARGQALLSGYS